MDKEAAFLAKIRAVGPLYKLNPVDPQLESAWFQVHHAACVHTLKAPGFNPCAYNVVISWFQRLLSK
jgi:hypothetical protein